MIKLTELLKESMALGVSNRKTPKLTLEDKKKMLSTISRYANFGPGLATKNLTEMLEQIEEIIGAAKTAIISEESDWFNKIVLKEDMKNLEKNYADFNKVVRECVAYQQQMEALYENMGHILGRYFDILPPAKSTTPTVDTTQNGLITKESADHVARRYQNVKPNRGKTPVVDTENEGDIIAREAAISNEVRTLDPIEEKK